MTAMSRAIVVCLLILVSGSGWAKKEGRISLNQVRLERLVSSVAAFKHDVAKNAGKAFDVHGTKAVGAQSRRIGKEVDFGYHYQLTWSFLIGYSAYIPVHGKTTTPVVGFYNPWCDCFVLTQWRHDDDSCRIVDIDVLSAELVRAQKPDELPIKPIWMRLGQDNLPFALAFGVTRTVEMFEARFTGPKAVSFRTAIPAVQLHADKRYPPIALQLATAITRAETLVQIDRAANPALATAAAHTKLAMSNLAQGNVDALLQIADKTLPSTAKLLKRLPKERFRRLQIVAVAEAGHKTHVFLTGINGPPAVFGLWIEGQHLTRFDIIDLQAAYLRAKKERQE